MHTIDARIYSENEVRVHRQRVTLGLLILQVFDLWITFKALDVGAYEANPVARVLIGFGLIIPLKLGIAALALWRVHSTPKNSRFRANNISELHALGMAYFVLGIYALVGVLNTVTYFSLR